MRIALLADLHANREALDACLADARRRGAARYVFLGDLVGYGADPGYVVDVVREAVAGGAVAVLGNHDEAVARAPRESMHPDARAAVEWTRGVLPDDARAWLGALPLSVEDGDALYVHANAWSPAGWGYLAGRLEAGRSLDATRASLTCVGHVHDPMLYTRSGTGTPGAFRPFPGEPIPLSGARRWLAIAGSVGQPRDGEPAACWAMRDLEARTLTFFRVPYDHASAAAKVRAAGLPETLARRLETAL